MPGVYAPPAVAGPKPTVMVGTPSLLSCVWFLKPAPPRMKMSAWWGRSAPADSLRLIHGSRLARTTSWKRAPLSTERGFIDPPR